MTVTQAPRKTRFRLVATLGRTGLDPQDLFGKFPSDSSHVISSPFPELCSAHATFTFVELFSVPLLRVKSEMFVVEAVKVPPICIWHRISAINEIWP